MLRNQDVIRFGNNITLAEDNARPSYLKQPAASRPLLAYSLHQRQ